MIKALVAALLAFGLTGLVNPKAARAEGPVTVAISSTNASSLTTYISTTNVSGYPLKFFSLQVKGKTAAATSWDVRLEGSLDGVNYAQILKHQTADGDGSIDVTSGGPFMTNFIRVRVNAVSLGSATGLNITALGSQ